MVSLSHLRTRKKKRADAGTGPSRCLLKYLAPPYVWRLHRRNARTPGVIILPSHLHPGEFRAELEALWSGQELYVEPAACARPRCVRETLVGSPTFSLQKLQCLVKDSRVS
jgi:hypothetical protein